MGLQELVPGRDCGDCTVCCIVPAIDDSDLQKKSGAPCRHCRTQSANGNGPGCTAYDARPGVCRTFYCAWRYMAEMDDSWRPDRAQVYATLQDLTLDGKPVPAITLTLTADAQVTARAPWFVDFVRARGLAEKPVFLALPAESGRKPASILLPVASLAKAARQGAASVQALLEQGATLMQQLPKDAHILKHSGNDVGL